jgi:flagellin
MSNMINTNVASLNAQRNLSTSQAGLTTALQRLSSGLRINSAKDDAAGLSISDRMTSQIRGLNQATRNANDGISVAQTAEGGLSEMTNIVQRMRELAVQSANASNTSSDRASLQSEVGQLKEELTRIASTTSFNGQRILDGSFQNTSFQVGADANQTIGVSIGDSRASALGTNVVSTNNTTNGLVAPNKNSLVTSAGATLVGQATAAAAAPAVNGLTAQTLTIRDASGNALHNGTVSVLVNDQVSNIADKLNKIDGVTASGNTSLKLSSFVGAADTNTVTFTIKSGATSSTLLLEGITNNSSQAATFTALRDAINGNSNLTSAGVVSGLDGDGNIVVRNNTGADLAVTIASTTASTLNVQGSDTAATSIALTGVAAGNGSTSVSGQLSVFLAGGYTAESSLATATGLFKGTANNAVVPASTSQGVAGDVSLKDTAVNRIDTTGSANVLTGKASALGASYAASLNGYTAQTLTVRDSSGAAVPGGSITVALSDQITTAVANLNNITGVKATGSNQAKLSTYTVAGGTAAGFVTFKISSGNTTSTLQLDGVSEVSTQNSVFNALKNAINNDSSLQAAGVSANINGAGEVVLKNNTGADLGVELNATAATSTVIVKGSDKLETTRTLLAGGATDSTRIGGQLSVSLPAGYTVESSVAAATSLFDAAISSAVVKTTTGANQGNNVSAQTLNIQGAASAAISIDRDSTAKQIADKVNGSSGATGVTAEAVTKAKLSGLSSAGTVSFSLTGSNTSPVTINALVTGSGTSADLTALANAINTQSGNTGIRASLDDNKSSVILQSDTGENIQITNFSHSGGTAPNSSNINGVTASLQVSGVADLINGATGSFATTSTAAVTLTSGGNAANAKSTVVGGTVSFKSSNSFSVSSSVSGGTSTTSAGGNSSIFSASSGTPVTSGLSSIAALDVSTVDGANRAIQSLDGALSQINNIRGSLGAIQNRFNSTISSLQATSENLSGARSRIQDADFASETASLSRGQILQQAGTAMLAQANSLPNGVLALLRG